MRTYSEKGKCEPDISNLVEQYGNSLLRMCYLYLKDMQLAEDAVQDTFINAYRNWDRFKGKSSEKTWLTSIAINVCKTQYRSSWRKNTVYLDELQSEPFDNDIIRDDTVLNEIAKLKPAYREVILLFFFLEMKQREIAEALNISDSAVAVRLTRAREQLKHALKGWYFNE